MLNQIKEDILDKLIESDILNIARELKCDMLSYKMLLKEWGISPFQNPDIEPEPFGIAPATIAWSPWRIGFNNGDLDTTDTWTSTITNTTDNTSTGTTIDTLENLVMT